MVPSSVELVVFHASSCPFQHVEILQVKCNSQAVTYSPEHDLDKENHQPGCPLRNLDPGHVVAAQPTCWQKAGGSVGILLRKEDLIGFTELRIKLTDTLRYEMRDPGQDRGRSLNYARIR